MKQAGRRRQIADDAPDDLAEVLARHHLLEELRAGRGSRHLPVEGQVVRGLLGRDEVEVAGLEVPDPEPGEIRRLIGASAENEPDLGRARGPVAAPHTVRLEDHRRHGVVGHRANGHVQQTPAREGRAEEPGDVAALEAGGMPPLGHGEGDRTVDPLEARRERVHERELVGRPAVAADQAVDRGDDHVEDPVRGGGLVILGEREGVLPQDPHRP